MWDALCIVLSLHQKSKVLQNEMKLMSTFKLPYWEKKTIVQNQFTFSNWIRSSKPTENCWIVKKYIQPMQVKFCVHCDCTLGQKCSVTWKNVCLCCSTCSEWLLLGKVSHGQILEAFKWKRLACLCIFHQKLWLLHTKQYPLSCINRVIKRGSHISH